MKSKILYILILLLLGNIVSYGQSHLHFRKMGWLHTEKPAPPLTIFQSLQAGYLSKSIQTHNLKGNVKSIRETSTYNPEIAVRYEFLKNGKLSLFQIGDSLDGKWQYEKYFYDEATGKLLMIEIYQGIPQYTSKAVHKLDNDGYMTQTIYECYDCTPGYKKEHIPYAYDYTLDYRWSENRDSVYLKFLYKVPSAGYSRYKDRSYSHMDSAVVLTKYYLAYSEIMDRLMTRYYPESYAYDDRGNMIKRTILDLEPKAVKGTPEPMVMNNADWSSEYQYNDRNDLIQQVVYTRRDSNTEWEKVAQYDITYTQYDPNGNWTEKQITKDKDMYIYKREIEYYE